MSPHSPNSPLNLPNALTLVRILFIPVIIVLLHGEQTENGGVWAGALFGLAFCTDFIDGMIARRTGAITQLGRILDPIADKLMVLTALLMLMHLGRIPVVVAILLLGREIAVSGLRSLAASEGISIPSSRSAKMKTVFEGFALGFLMAGNARFLGVPWMLSGTILLYLSLVLALWSGGVYFYEYYRAVRDKTPA